MLYPDIEYPISGFAFIAGANFVAVTWSYAATGLSLALVGLVIGKNMIPLVNRPSIFRSKAGEAMLSALGMVLMASLLFFGFRLFWDNGLWAILQLLIISFVVGAVARFGFLQNAVALVAVSVLSVAQAVKTW